MATPVHISCPHDPTKQTSLSTNLGGTRGITGAEGEHGSRGNSKRRRNRTRRTRKNVTKRAAVIANLAPAQEARMRFDHLPDAAIDRIFRFLGSKPRHIEWELTVPPETVLSLLQCGGTLRRVSQKAFTTLQCTSRRSQEWRDCEWDEVGVRVHGSPRIAALLIQGILMGLSQGLRSLYLRTSLSPAISRLIYNHCTELRRLTLSPVDHCRLPRVASCNIIVSCGSSPQNRRLAIINLLRPPVEKLRSSS